jgi:hypothetical protein
LSQELLVVIGDRARGVEPGSVLELQPGFSRPGGPNLISFMS